MADITTLRCWPCCLFALDWSHDNMLAMASEEHVYLLIPDTQVPWFTDDQLPKKEPAILENYSIGDEISASFPVDIKWSAPGLGKYRQCVLACLTSNMALSIWAGEGRVSETVTWKRRAVVNDALGQIFLEDQTRMQDEYDDILGRLRIWRRIRAYSWAPGMPAEEEEAIVGTRLDWGQHLIAVANDENHVFIVRIDSTAQYDETRSLWSTKVLNSFVFTPAPTSIFEEPQTFDEYLNEQKFMSHLSWSSWVRTSHTLFSVLVYVTNDGVYGRVVSYSNEEVTFGPEVQYMDTEFRYSCPPKWLPYTTDANFVTLLLVSNSGDLSRLKISTMDGSVHDKSIFPIEDSWDSISGIVIESADESSPTIHLSSLLSTTSNMTGAYQLDPSDLTAQEQPAWHDRLFGQVAELSGRHNLEGKARAKVWGLCASPLGDLIASVHTLNPSDMIQYGPPANRQTMITISNMRGSGQELVFPKKHVGTASLVFTIRKWWDLRVEDESQAEIAKNEVLEKLIQTYPSPPLPAPQDSPIQPAAPTATLNQLAGTFKRNIFLNPNTLKDRYEVLVSPICSPKDPPELPKTMIAYRHATAVSQLGKSANTSLAPSDFSQQTLAQCREVVRLVQCLISDVDAPIQVRHNNEPESCNICESKIPFNDLWQASCSNHHLFARCGITYQAIQQPKTAKWCGQCGQVCFSDEFVLLQETDSSEASSEGGINGDVEMQDGDNQPNQDAQELEQSSSGGAMDGVEEGRTVREEDPLNFDRVGLANGSKEEKQLPVTLARVIFQACDVCMYCGGNYVG